MNQNAEWILEKIKIENKLHDIIARTTDKYVTVTYNNQKTTLASALASIFADISLMPTAAGIDEKIESAKKAVKDNLLGGVVPDTMNTLKKIADYIEMHREAAEALNQAMDNKVDKVEGKGLSTEDFTAEFKAILEALPAITAENVDNWNNKVDKIPGKGLSSNDFTSDEKTKLAELENYDDTTVKGDIGAIKTVNERQDTDITNLKTDNANNKTNIQSLQTKAGELETEVANKAEDITELNNGKVSKSGDTMTGQLVNNTARQQYAHQGANSKMSVDLYDQDAQHGVASLIIAKGENYSTGRLYENLEDNSASVDIVTNRTGLKKKIGNEVNRFDEGYIKKVQFDDNDNHMESIQENGHNGITLRTGSKIGKHSFALIEEYDNTNVTEFLVGVNNKPSGRNINIGNESFRFDNAYINNILFADGTSMSTASSGEGSNEIPIIYNINNIVIPGTSGSSNIILNVDFLLVKHKRNNNILNFLYATNFSIAKGEGYPDINELYNFNTLIDVSVLGVSAMDIYNKDNYITEKVGVAQRTLLWVGSLSLKFNGASDNKNLNLNIKISANYGGNFNETIGVAFPGIMKF
jgi:hypothetical protein